MRGDDNPTAYVQRMLFLRSLPAAREVGGVASQLATAARDMYFDAGANVYAQGGASDTLYFIVEGDVELVREGHTPWRFGPRDGFGFFDAMLTRPHSRTAIAVSDLHLLAIPIEDWLDILEDNFTLGRAMIRLTSEVLHERALALSPHGGFGPYVPRDLGIDDVVGLVDRITVLRDSDVLYRANVQSLATLAALSVPRHVRAGEPVFGPSAGNSALYLVARGHVELVHRTPDCSALFGPGQLIGGLATLGSHAFDAVAAQDTKLLMVRQDDWLDVMEDHFDIARAALRFIALERERVQQIGLGASIPSRAAV